jgi:hypothetical protein
MRAPAQPSKQAVAPAALLCEPSMSMRLPSIAMDDVGELDAPVRFAGQSACLTVGIDVVC